MILTVSSLFNDFTKTIRNDFVNFFVLNLVANNVRVYIEWNISDIFVSVWGNNNQFFFVYNSSHRAIFINIFPFFSMRNFILNQCDATMSHRVSHRAFHRKITLKYFEVSRNRRLGRSSSFLALLILIVFCQNTLQPNTFENNEVFVL